MTTTDRPPIADEATEPDRRQLFAEVAEHGISGFVGDDSDLDSDTRLDLAIDALAYVVQELCAQFSDETLRSMLVLGQLVGGLFGTGTTAEGDMLTLYKRGQELRARIEPA